MTPVDALNRARWSLELVYHNFTFERARVPLSATTYDDAVEEARLSLPVAAAAVEAYLAGKTGSPMFTTWLCADYSDDQSGPYAWPMATLEYRELCTVDGFEEWNKAAKR